MEVPDLFRRVGSVAFAIPRQLANIVDAGSVENALEQIKDSTSRRSIETALQAADSQGPAPAESESVEEIAVKSRLRIGRS